MYRRRCQEELFFGGKGKERAKNKKIMILV